MILSFTVTNFTRERVPLGWDEGERAGWKVRQLADATRARAAHALRRGTLHR